MKLIILFWLYYFILVYLFLLFKPPSCCCLCLVSWLVIIIRPTREQNKLRKAKFCIKVWLRLRPTSPGVLDSGPGPLLYNFLQSEVLAVVAIDPARRRKTKKPCPGNCILACMQIKLQQGRQRPKTFIELGVFFHLFFFLNLSSLPVNLHIL